MKKKVAMAGLGLALLLSVPVAMAQEDDGPLVQMDVDSSGETTVTTDDGAGNATIQSGADPVEVNDSDGDTVGTVTTQPEDDGGEGNN